MRLKNPCINCVAPDRHVGCHATCTKGYIEWRKEKDKENRKITEAKKKANFYSKSDYIQSTMFKK